MRGKKRRLTDEHEEVRLDGLRVLARLVVRVYLASPVAAAAEVGRGASAPGVPTGRKPPGKHGRHAR